MARGTSVRPRTTPPVDPPGGASGINVVVVRGVIAREPLERTDADDVVHLSFELRIRRAAGGPSELVPVTWPERTLGETGLAEKNEVVIMGRVRQRFFRVGGATQSRTEVVAESVLGVRQQAAIRRLLADAAAVLTDP